MTKSILYVEDHLNNMLLVKRIVEAEGHDFTSAVDGERGWKMAVSQNPDMILVDLHLPGAMDGYDLLARLKSDPVLKAIPAVVLTASDDDVARARAEALGSDDFLLKPADIQQIRAVVRRYLGAPARQPFALPRREWHIDLARVRQHA